jgi:hypothetical protein
MNVAAVFAPKKAYEFLGYETFTCVHNANKAHDGMGRLHHVSTYRGSMSLPVM